MGSGKVTVERALIDPQLPYMDKARLKHIFGVTILHTAFLDATSIMDLYRFCAGHLSHYATLASNASGLMPPRYEWRRRVL